MSNAIVPQLFSFHGRNNRAAFARIFGVQMAAYAILEVALIKQHLGGINAIIAAKGHVVASLPPGFSVALPIFMLVMSWIAWANHARRLHDFGWSGWMQIAPLGVYLCGLAGLLGVGFGGGLRVVGGLVAIVGMAGAGLFGLALLGMMFFRKGDAGQNRFDDPNQPAAGERTRLSQTFKPTAHGAGFAQASVATYAAAYRSPQTRAPGFGRRGA